MADLIRILKNDLYDYRWSVDGNKYGESYDVTTQDGFSDPTLEKAGWERVLKVNGSLFYTYDSAHYACGLEKAFGDNHQDTSMTAVSDYNDAMAIACLEDGSLIFDKQSNIISNYLDSAYGAITGLGVLLNGATVDMYTGFDTQWNQISGRTVIGVDKDGNFLSYSFEGTTGSSGLTGAQVQTKCLTLGFYNAIMLDGGGSVFREYLRSYDISSSRSVKNALMLYRKRKTNPFIPRTSKTLPSDMTYTSSVTNWNRWWYEDTFNAGATASVCLPNCTTYAIGRSGEIANKSCRDYEIMDRTGFPNASDWFANAKWETGQTPKLGAIACWTDNGNNWGGHVAIVEQTDGTNKGTYLSMSGYQAASSGTRSFTNPGKDASWYFQYLDFTTTNYYYTTYDDRGGSFLGYIYNPYIEDSAEMPTEVSRDTTQNQLKVNTDVTLKVRLDPSTNSKTLGTITSSDNYYNVLDVTSDADYTWYQIGENDYVADDGSWVTYYEAETSTYYTVTLNASPEEGGAVEGAGSYEAGITCTISATPNTNYTFNSWSDENTDNPRSLTVDSNIELSANFDYIQPAVKYKVNATISPSAAATAGCYVTGTGEYEVNTVVTLTAIAVSGYKFDSWSDGQTTGSISINVTRDINAVANFSVDTSKYKVTTECEYDDFGTMTGAGEYSAGESVTIAADIVNSKYKFNCWYMRRSEASSILSTINQNPYTFSCYDDYEFTLSLTDASKYKTVTLHSNNDEWGSVEGAGTFETGITTTISAIAKGGYMFVKWSDDNTLATRSITVNDNIELTAYFAKSSYSTIIVQINGESNVTENLNASFVNYSKNYIYKFYLNGTLWGTSTTEDISLLVNNDFEANLLTSTKGTFYLDVEAVDSDGDTREYQRNIPFVVNIPDSFGLTLDITESTPSNQFNNYSVASFTSWILKYKVTQTAPSGYTNHAVLGNVSASATIGDVRLGQSQVTYICTGNSSDYDSTITLQVADGRRTVSASKLISVKGYYSPAYRLRKLELQKATENKYNCFIAFSINIAGVAWGNSVYSQDITIEINGKTYSEVVAWDDYNAWLYATVGDASLEEGVAYTITVKYRDRVLAALSSSTWYTAVQSLNSKLPLSLYDDTEGNVGVAFGEQSVGENVVKLGMETTFGTGVQLNASKYDNNGNILEVSKDAYDLLAGDWDTLVTWEDTNGKYANRIKCMTGEEYSALTTKSDHILYFLTSTPKY